MAAVEITGWQHDFRKVACNHRIRAATRLELADAKRVVDAVLEGKVQRLEIPSDDAARDLVAARKRRRRARAIRSGHKQGVGR